MLDAGVSRTIATRLVYPDMVRDPDRPHDSPAARTRTPRTPFKLRNGRGRQRPRADALLLNRSAARRTRSFCPDPCHLAGHYDFTPGMHRMGNLATSSSAIRGGPPSTTLSTPGPPSSRRRRPHSHPDSRGTFQTRRLRQRLPIYEPTGRRSFSVHCPPLHPSGSGGSGCPCTSVLHRWCWAQSHS